MNSQKAGFDDQAKASPRAAFATQGNGMTPEERQAERARIRDEDLARMDDMAAKYGEGHHLFWLAMQFATERLRQFDQRHPVTR